MKLWEKLAKDAESAHQKAQAARHLLLLNDVIDDKGFYALDTKLQNKLLKLRQGKCKSCKCSN